MGAVALDKVHDGNLASILLATFTVCSGLIRPSAKAPGADEEHGGDAEGGGHGGDGQGGGGGPPDVPVKPPPPVEPEPPADPKPPPEDENK